jgi:hypothetical protein
MGAVFPDRVTELAVQDDHAVGRDGARDNRRREDNDVGTTDSTDQHNSTPCIDRSPIAYRWVERWWPRLYNLVHHWRGWHCTAAPDLHRGCGASAAPSSIAIKG